jgi:hypothetical protein
MLLKIIIGMFFSGLVLSGCAQQRDLPKTDCAFSAGACTKAVQDMQVSFDITPKHVPAMAELVFTVLLQRQGKPVDDAHVSLDLTMPGMYMGLNRPLLKFIWSGRYEGKGILQRCPSGQKIWKAEVVIEHPSFLGKALKTGFLFEAAK